MRVSRQAVKDIVMHSTKLSTLTPSDTQDWHLRAEMSLAILAQKAELMTYDDFAKACEVPAPHRIHKLTLFLETLIALDCEQQQAIRAALIISKVRGIPAPGFFEAIRKGGIAYQKGGEVACHQSLLLALNPAFAPHHPSGS